MGRRLALGELRVRPAANSSGHYVIERRGRGEGGRGGGGQGRPAGPARLAQQRGWGWSACFNPCKAAPLSLCSLVTVPKEGGLGRTRPGWKTHAHSAEVGLGGGTRAHPALDPPPARSRGDPGRSGRAHGARGRDARAGGEMLQGGALRPHAAHLRPAAAGTAVPAARRARPPSLSASAARPSPARPGSARPRRPRRSARSACAAAAAAAPPPLARPPRSARPRDPLPPAVPAAPAAGSAGPRAVTRPATACHRQRRSRGPEVASHGHTPPRGHTLPRWVTYSVMNIIHMHTLTRSHPLTWGHTGSNIQTHMQLHTCSHWVPHGHSAR